MKPTWLLSLTLLGACSSGQGAQSELTSADRVAIVGDSITEQSADAIAQALGDEYQVRIVARIGKTFDSSQADADIAATESPAVVIVELGTNDVWTEAPLPTISREMDAMLAKFPDACVAMVTVNEDTKNARSLDGTLYDNTRASELNEAIRRSAEHVIDWNAAANEDPTRYLDQGTIHPTAEGRVLLASLMDDAAATCTASD